MIALIQTFLMLMTMGQQTQAFGLSQPSIKIKQAYHNLVINQNSKQLQAVYLKTIPDNYIAFAKVFNPPNFEELYDSCDYYLFLLEVISENYPKELCTKLISIAKDGEQYKEQSDFIADAPAILQNLTISIANKIPDIFINSIKALHESEKDSLITFLADVENQPTTTRRGKKVSNQPLDLERENKLSGISNAAPDIVEFGIQDVGNESNIKAPGI